MKHTLIFSLRPPQLKQEQSLLESIFYRHGADLVASKIISKNTVFTLLDPEAVFMMPAPTSPLYLDDTFKLTEV